MPSTKVPILVVEDDLAIRESLKELFEVEGYPVLLAEHGLRALDVMNSAEPTPGLILLDLSMPIMDGVTFLSEFKLRFPQYSALPILVMTAAGTQVYPTGHDPKMIMRKPLDVNQLMDVVEAYC